MKHFMLYLITLGWILSLMACRTSSPGVEAGAADYSRPGDLALPPDVSTPVDLTKQELAAGEISIPAGAGPSPSTARPRRPRGIARAWPSCACPARAPTG